MASFPDREAHVVVTARDLGRQIPAEWQERVKHRGGRDYAAFLKALQRNYTRTDWTVWFWRVQHLPRILATLGRRPCRPSRSTSSPCRRQTGHATCCGSGSRSVLGLDPRASYAESETINASLGGAEVTMLRRLNGACPSRRCRAPSTSTGSARASSRRCSPSGPTRCGPRCRPSRPAVDQITASWLEQIRSLGVDVVGDLADLESVWPDDEDRWADPDQADPEVVADAAIEALAHVLTRVGRAPVTDDDTGTVARLTRVRS